jgi:hypothetical protein
VKEFSDKLNLMVATTRENSPKTIVLNYAFHQQEEFCSVEQRIKKNHQEALNVISSQILNIWKSFKLMTTMELKNYA